MVARSERAELLGGESTVDLRVLRDDCAYAPAMRFHRRDRGRPPWRPYSFQDPRSPGPLTESRARSRRESRREIWELLGTGVVSWAIIRS
jgi:hypothetical protein